MKRSLSLLMLALFLLVAPLYCSLVAQAQGVVWDPRLSELGVTLSPAQDTSQGYWQLISARYEDEQESQGLHHVFTRLYDEQGNMIAGAPWAVSWPDGSVTAYTKAPPEWADFPLWDCFFPNIERGAYSVYAGDDPARSETMAGLGLPACFHVSYRLEWRFVSPCPSCVPRLWLPIVANYKETSCPVSLVFVRSALASTQVSEHQGSSDRLCSISAFLPASCELDGFLFRVRDDLPLYLVKPVA